MRRNLEGNRYDANHARREGRRASGLLLVVAVLGCGGDASGPPAPGSIRVTTETTGFLKAAGYEVVVDGVSTMAIGADDEVTLSELEPGSYLVGLAEVPANCAAEDVQVSVESEQTADVLMSVECTYVDLVQFSIQFSRERPDLDTEAITVCSFGLCPTQEAWDLYVYSDADAEPRSVIRQNQTAGVEIAHVPGVTLAELTEADYTAATFTTELIGDPFDAGRVILIRTDLGSVYALGNPAEDLSSSKLTFDAALIVEP